MKSAKSILIALTLTLAPLYLISPPAALSDCGGDSEDCCKAKDEKGKDNKKAEEKVKDQAGTSVALTIEDKKAETTKFLSESLNSHVFAQKPDNRISLPFIWITHLMNFVLN